MTILKKIFFIIALFIIILVIAAFALVYFIDPNQLKPILIEETHKHTGQHLEITGPLSWRFYPRLAIHADAMNLREQKQLPPTVSFMNVNVVMDLMQLLKGKQDWQGKLFIGSLQSFNLTLENIILDVNWQNQTVLLQNIRALFYGGTLQGNGTGKNLSTLPHWQWNVQITNMQLQNLIQGLQRGTNKLNIIGNAQLEFRIETSGHPQAAFINNMQGIGAIKVQNGHIQGLDLNYYIETADALMNKRINAELVNTNQTPFDLLQGNFIIQNGMVITENLILTSPILEAKAKGNLLLMTSALNLHLSIMPKQTALAEWNIPLLITGDLHHPNIQLEFNQLDKLIPDKDLQKIKSKALEKIKERIHGKPGELLQRLLKD